MLFKKRIYLTRYEEFFFNLKNKRNKKSLSKGKKNPEELRNNKYDQYYEEQERSMVNRQMQLMMRTPRKKFWVRRGSSVTRK